MIMTHNDDAIEINLPHGLSKPVIRALSVAGYWQLEHFAKLSEIQVVQIYMVCAKNHKSYP